MRNFTFAAPQVKMKVRGMSTGNAQIAAGHTFVMHAGKDRNAGTKLMRITDLTETEIIIGYDV